MVSGSTVTITADFAGGGCGGTVLFTGDDAQTLTLSVTDNNFNTGVGVSAVGQVISTGSNNSCFGTAAGSLIYTGSNNSSLGYSALFGATDFSGSDNIAIGYNSATNYVTSESNNIIIGNIGVASESNVIRIGTQGSGTGQQDKCFIAGIEGVSVSNLNYVTIDTATGQLGSAATGGGIVTIDGDSGSITGTTVKIYANTASTNCGSSVKFVNSGTTSTLNVTDANDNVIIGSGSGNSSISGTANSFLGFDVAPSLTSGSANVGIGAGSLNSVTMGGHNVVVGENSLALLSSGNFNSALGQSAGGSLTTGQYNTFLGYNSGQAYTSSESSNILIGNNGVISESNTIRIGTQGSSSAQQNTCYVAGIAGVSVSNLNYVTINTSTGQLGSSATAGAIITLDGDSGSATGSTVTISGGTTGLTTSASSATIDLTGTLKLANGGTNANLTASDGGIFYSTATAGGILSGTSTANLVLLSGASTTPSWSSNALGFSGVNPQTGTYILAATDFASGVVTVNDASAATITIPDTSTATVALGGVCTVANIGTGVVTLAKQSTDTLIGNITLNTNDVATIVKIVAGTPNTYIVIGGTSVITYEWNLFIPSVANTTYYFSAQPSFAGTLTNIAGLTASGSCTVTVNINGTPVTGTALSATSTLSSQSITGTNTFLAGSSYPIEAVVTSNSAGTNLALTLTYTRSF